MSDTEVQLVWRCLQQQSSMPIESHIDVINLNAFEHVLQSMLVEDEVSRIAEDDVRLLAALYWFGPRNAGTPPVTLYDELHELIHEMLPAHEPHRSRITEIVIAYGCGSWRQVEPGDGQWRHRWQRALEWVTHQVLGWIKATAAWLYFDIHLPGYAFFPSRSTATELASLLWLGKCDCWRLQQADIDARPDHRSKLRVERCLREHRLTAWNPAQTSLPDFIACAVKGDKAKGNRSHRKGFVSGAVIQGMFFCELYRECDVRFGKVLGWRCPRHVEDFFEKGQCPYCEESGEPTVFHEEQHNRDVVRRLLVRTPSGPYSAVEYWHCQQGDTYYHTQHPVCPRCHAPRTQGAAKSTVWVRALPFRRVELSPTVPHSESEDLETTTTLREALEQLASDERKALMLVVLEERSRTEAARALGVSLAQLDQRLESAKEKMKTFLS